MRASWSRWWTVLLAAQWVLAAGLAFAADAPSWQAAVGQAAEWRRSGHVQRAIDLLTPALAAAPTPEARARLQGELGAALLQARRLDEAQPLLEQASRALQGTDRATYLLHLGNVHSLRRQPGEALAAYEAALALSERQSDLWFAAASNRVRLLPEPRRLAALREVGAALDAAGAAPGFGRHHLSLGDQGRRLGTPALGFAYRHLARAQSAAAAERDARLALEAADAMAQLYEEQDRGADALAISRQALAGADSRDQPLLADVQASLEWRRARLHARAGEPQAALAALSRAVDLIRSIRSDMPIEYDDGKSTFRQTLEPLYLAYADALLQASDRQSPVARPDSLRRVVDVIEELKQAELQDYLGDRCAVEAVQGGAPARLPAGVAALYTIVFADRLELLLVTADGIARRTTPVRGEVVRATASALAQTLREGLGEYAPAARQLHEWMLRPVADLLAEQKVHSLVMVPDASLRTVPPGALVDGNQFLIEKYAVSTVTGLSITNAAEPPRKSFAALVVGVADPGPVVDKLAGTAFGAALLQSMGTVQASRGAGATRRNVRSLAGLGTGLTRDNLRERLRLPGVAREVSELRGVLPGKTLLDAEFTLRQFAAEAESGRYRILHVASHGVFGGSPESSFILAFDDLLTMDGLQAILKAETFTRTPVELLTLSACETAEGNDRAPLGLSGAAVKARAKSVLGTLWPVDDDAAQLVMKVLYEGVVRDGLSKTEALRRAQLALLRNPATRDPVFWAPFVVIGNWL